METSFKRWLEARRQRDLDEGVWDRIKGAAAGAVQGWQDAAPESPPQPPVRTPAKLPPAPTGQPVQQQPRRPDANNVVRDAIDKVLHQSPGYEKFAAVEVWTHYWDGKLGPRNSKTDEMMTGLLQKFGYEVFYPTDMFSQPTDWLDVQNSRPRTGVVSQVHRPGLIVTSGNDRHIAVPAKVTVE